MVRLARAPVPWARARVAVLGVEGRDGARPGFLPALWRRLSAGEWAARADRVLLVEVGPRLGPDDHYVLDDHMRENGHRLVAEALADAIRAADARGSAG